MHTAAHRPILTRLALAAALLPSLAPSTAILVKGSRGARMERVTDRLRGAP